MRAGDIHQNDFQSDVYGGRYKLIERVGPKTWVTEVLPDDSDVIDKIVEFWAHEEARGARRTPIWNKTWKECTGDERPEIVGEQTYEEMMMDDLAWREQFYGQRRTVKFISSAQYADYF
jgi:hypothetical protein